jgi:glycosyltransferase involved in cell wall biosynthesis
MNSHLVAIDARPLSRGYGGITRYTMMALPSLLTLPNVQLVLYTDRPIAREILDELGSPKVRVLRHQLGASWAWYWVIPFWLRKDKPSLFWSPRQHLPAWLRKSTKSVVTVHDLVWTTCPQTMPFLQRISERCWMPYSVKRADSIITVSETTRVTLLRVLPYSKEKVSVIKHACLVRNDMEFEPISQEERCYFLAVGTVEPRKNYQTLIEGFNCYAREGGLKNLVIVGQDGWKTQAMYEALAASPYRDRIKVLNDVSDQQLAQLYSAAFSLVSASLDEGFGLPLLEAQAFGLPMCVSSIPIYRELFADAEAWFDPSSYRDVATALKSVSAQRHDYTTRLTASAVMKDAERCQTAHRQLFSQMLEQGN